MSMQETEVDERLHKLEMGQAVQEAVQAGAEATQGAMHAGAASTNAAAHAGTVGMVVAGSVALVVGLFLGLAIGSSKRA